MMPEPRQIPLAQHRRALQRRRRGRVLSLWPHVPVAILLLVSGVLNIIFGDFTVRGRAGVAFAGLAQYGGAVGALGRTTETVLGGALALISIGLFWRVRAAWAFAIVLIGLTVALDLAQHQWGTGLVLPVIMLAALFASRNAFNRRPLAANLLVSLLSVLFVLVYGTLGAYLLGSGFNPPIHNVLVAFYYTVATLATVGGNTPNTFETRMFETTLIIVGLGIFTTAFVSSVGPAITTQLNLIFNPKGSPMRLHEHVIVIGDGSIAANTVRELQNRAIDLVQVISSSGEPVAQEGRFVRGNACSDEALKKAGIERASMVVAALDDDVTNAMVALVARNLNAKIRVLGIASSGEAIRRLKLAGTDIAFAPAVAASRLMADLVEGQAISPEFADLIEQTT